MERAGDGERGDGVVVVVAESPAPCRLECTSSDEFMNEMTPRDGSASSLAAAGVGPATAEEDEEEGYGGGGGGKTFEEVRECEWRE